MSTADALDVLADRLDDLSLETLADLHPDWILWQHDGRYFARRRVEQFTETRGDLRKFSVDAATVGRLAVLLLIQAALDAEQ